ncbi:hypothetical protein [Sansalvadorimonas verongulae]|uniref:hypothetical protein n=1 Tax=Sansalvadorimonas verongulae TaxID=2172824 RepID=UPI0012BD5453|nr:hypothetical protein [Sansalvadorimonas verongulae]MTI15211.1 hypothetical protein [Sansalvadorimonas verongulae]
MSNNKKLSPEMQKAFNRLQEHGRLIKYSGGFWSAPGVACRKSHLGTGLRIPAWHYGTRTIQGLIRRDLARVVRERKWEGKVYPVGDALQINSQKRGSRIAAPSFYIFLTKSPA